MIFYRLQLKTILTFNYFWGNFGVIRELKWRKIINKKSLRSSYCNEFLISCLLKEEFTVKIPISRDQINYLFSLFFNS